MQDRMPEYLAVKEPNEHVPGHSPDYERGNPVHPPQPSPAAIKAAKQPLKANP